MDVTSALGARFGLDELLAVANTRHGPGGHRGARASASQPAHDHLADPVAAAEFLGGHGIDVPDGPPDARQLAGLRGIRSALLEAAGLPPVGRPSSPAPRLEAPTRYRLDVDGRLVADAAGWDAIVADLRLSLATFDPSRDRLRTCGNPLCRWLFVDRSRNRSRVWCEMAVCGNRAKVGRHRRRRT